MSLHAIYNRDFKLIAMFRDRDRAMVFMDERFDLEILELRRFRHLNEAHLMVMGYAEAVKLEEFAAANTDLDKPLWAEGDLTSVAGIQLPERPSITHDGFTCRWEGCETYNPPARIYLESIGREPQYDWLGDHWHSMDRWGNYHLRCTACEYGYTSFRARAARGLAGERLYPEISVVLHPKHSASEIIEKSVAALIDAGLGHDEMNRFEAALHGVGHTRGHEENVRRVVNDWMTVMMINHTELDRG